MAINWDRLVIGPNITIFGDRVSFTTFTETFEIDGAFDEAYLQLTPLGRGDDGMETFNFGSPGAITSARPVLGVRLSQFRVRPKQSDMLEILSGKHAGERFEVKEVRPDGHGHALLLLNEYAGP